jgi:hypothetical protein
VEIMLPPPPPEEVVVDLAGAGLGAGAEAAVRERIGACPCAMAGASERAAIRASARIDLILPGLV